MLVDQSLAFEYSCRCHFCNQNCMHKSSHLAKYLISLPKKWNFLLKIMKQVKYLYTFGENYRFLFNADISEASQNSTSLAIYFLQHRTDTKYPVRCPIMHTIKLGLIDFQSFPILIRHWIFKWFSIWRSWNIAYMLIWK